MGCRVSEIIVAIKLKLRDVLISETPARPLKIRKKLHARHRFPFLRDAQCLQNHEGFLAMISMHETFVSTFELLAPEANFGL